MIRTHPKTLPLILAYRFNILEYHTYWEGLLQVTETDRNIFYTG